MNKIVYDSVSFFFLQSDTFVLNWLNYIFALHFRRKISIWSSVFYCLNLVPILECTNNVKEMPHVSSFFLI